MTYNTFLPTRAMTASYPGVAGLAVRLGRALENWGREAADPIDRDARRREYERQLGIATRMQQMERLGLQRR
ncbi:MAG: hypothetical protein ABIR17_09285 [Pseudolysinimonas sp.]|uniref:hypothetical protein n=1 Tax=Pseudolysinimonas sp. TaxID=2680009 RepID=UPI003266F3B5